MTPLTSVDVQDASGLRGALNVMVVSAYDRVQTFPRLGYIHPSTMCQCDRIVQQLKKRGTFGGEVVERGRGREVRVGNLLAKIKVNLSLAGFASQEEESYRWWGHVSNSRLLAVPTVCQV